ncbi:MAG: hypothetical protein AAF696_04675 [Bacteroidota bacterium]
MSISPTKTQEPYIFSLNVSGADGKAGASSQKYSPDKIRYYGSKKQPGGGRGEHGSDGEDAKHIHVFISIWQKDFLVDTATKILLRLDIHIYEHEAVMLDRRKLFLEMSPGQKIKIIANGGEGGKGGYGGHGLNSNHHQFPPGKGGNGGHGGKGGDAGKIFLEAAASQSFLLSYFECETYQGQGGKGGVGGMGGRFLGGDRSLAGKKMKNGTDGLPGRIGEAGKITYLLRAEKEEKQEAFLDLFDIKVEKLRLEDAFPDGIYEFGEELTIQHLGIQSIGTMPTPEYVPIRLRIRENSAFHVEPSYVEVPGGIKERMRKNLFDCFKIELRKLGMDEISSIPVEEEAELILEAFLPGTDLIFPQAGLSHKIKIQYPLRIKDFQVLTSLMAGGTSMISWQVERLGQTVEFAGKKQGRKARMRIHFLGSLDSIPLSMLDDKGILYQDSTFPLFEQETDSQLQSDTYYLQLASGWEALGEMKAELILEISDIGNPDVFRAVQIIPFQLSISKAYQKTEDSDVLLVFHDEIDLASIQEIERFYEGIASPVDHWNLSLYVYLDLEEKRENGKSLLEDFEGKTILILNYPFKNQQNQQLLPAHFLRQDQFHKAVNEYGIEFLLLGESNWRQASFITWMNLPIFPRKIYNRYRSLEEFKAFIEERSHEIVDAKDGFLHRPLGNLAFPEDNVSLRSYEIFLSVTDFNRRYKLPSQEDELKRICRNLSKEMQERFPREQFFFIYEYVQNDPEGYVAKIEVKQGPHKVHGANMLAKKLDRSVYEETHDTSTPSVGFFLYLSLSNWEFNEMLTEFLAGKEGYLKTDQAIDDARDAILYRIVLEFLNLKRFHEISTEDLKERLGFFNMVFTHNIGQLNIHSPQTRLFGDLCVHILTFVQSQKSTRERMFLDKSEYRLSRLIQELLEDWISRNFDQSKELKRLDRALWERNRKEGRQFRNSLRGRRMYQMELLSRREVEARKPLQRVARDFYLKGVQNISTQSNYIFTREEFEALVNQWNLQAASNRGIEERERRILKRLRKGPDLGEN